MGARGHRSAQERPDSDVVAAFRVGHRNRPEHLRGDPGRRDNHSLGFGQTELLRRVNLALDAALGWPQYLAVVKEYLSAKVLSAQESRTDIVLPTAESGWVRDRAEQFARQIKAAGYDVVGDLTELVPDDAPEPEPEPTERELLDTAIAALANLAGRLPANPDQDRTTERVKRALRGFTEQDDGKSAAGALSCLCLRPPTSVCKPTPANQGNQDSRLRMTTRRSLHAGIVPNGVCWKNLLRPTESCRCQNSARFSMSNALRQACTRKVH